MKEVWLTLRILIAVVPLFISTTSLQAHAQNIESLQQELGVLEKRANAHEIADARIEERWLAVVSRIDSIDKTLWWLIVAIFGSSGVSAVVAGDRAVYLYRRTKNGR